MIKFFRHIRKTHVMENKTGKYLKYAIGEIVLVVIGILIALSINNWNEKRQESVSEINYLIGIKTDLESDIPTIELRINRILQKMVLILNSSNIELLSFRLEGEICFNEAIFSFLINEIFYSKITFPSISTSKSLRQISAMMYTTGRLPK